MKRNLRSSHADSFSRSYFFLQDLRRRSIVPTLPLYHLLRKTKRFTWTPEAEEALGNLKALFSNASVLVPPAAGEALLIYVATTT
jgi:hypothetical protein